jgi:apocytochrome f
MNFLNYPVYVGGNRGRGQIYPTGEKSNNNAYISNVSGQVSSITPAENGTTSIVVTTTAGEVIQTVPKGLIPDVKVKDIVTVDQPLTLNPNVGGFGQAETEIVLQSPKRVGGVVGFFFTVTLTQILLVLKKKQFEKVQAAEVDF